jgi:hypothetical protein
MRGRMLFTGDEFEEENLWGDFFVTTVCPW